jgi:hypothetical protein
MKFHKILSSKNEKKKALLKTQLAKFMREQEIWENNIRILGTIKFWGQFFISFL